MFALLKGHETHIPPTRGVLSNNEAGKVVSWLSARPLQKFVKKDNKVKLLTNLVFFFVVQLVPDQKSVPIVRDALCNLARTHFLMFNPIQTIGWHIVPHRHTTPNI